MTAAPARAFTARDADTLTRAFHSAFYSSDGANAHFRDTQAGGVTYFWGQAEMIECVIDAYEWTGDPAYQGMITQLLNGFLAHNGSDWSWNIYNDDIMWAVLAFARGGVATGHSGFCDIARANFDACFARAWDNVLGGGLYWTTGNWTKNACANGNAAIAACLLYEIYLDGTYLDQANDIYDWERSVLFNPGSGAIYDAIETNGTLHTWASTYNQGTFIGAAHFLGRLDDATRAANYTLLHLTGVGILPEYGIAGNNSGFNAIFLRWMNRFVRDRGLEATYGAWLQQNAEAAWSMRRPNDNLSWCQWWEPTAAGANLYAWDCISSYEALLAAEPTQGTVTLTVPGDPFGYWPLDETAGSVAPDASGSGNDGTLYGPGWDPGGQANGCLRFDGVDDSVRIDRSVGGDFSLACWVRTTQAGGVGQWYQGAGLVDGDVPFTRDDFGTAVMGGRFGFGIGNPDTTVVSATSINDGAWHLCVATRERHTGVIKVYVDGDLEGAGVGNTRLLDDAAELRFGAIASGGGRFDGYLDEVRIFPRVLAADEVDALYQCSVVPPAAAPTHLGAEAGNGRVRLTWWDAPAASRYRVKRSRTGTGPYLPIADVAATSYTDTTVTNRRSYFYVVSALNDVGEGPDSEPVAASPSALTAWFTADSLAGMANGTPVSAWTDSSGHGHTARQLLSAHRPTYVTGARTGLPGVRFNAAAGSYLWIYRPVQDDFTVMLVYQSSQGIGSGTGFWEGAGLLSGEMPAPVNDFAVSLNAGGRILAGTGNPDTSIHSGTGFNDGDPHVVTFKRTRATGAIGLYVDGSPAASSAGGTQALTAPNYLLLGAQAAFNNYLSGDIAEVLIFDAALPDEERLGYERALMCRYDLPGGAPPPAPTDLAAAPGNREVRLNWTLSPGTTDYTVWRSTDDGASYQVAAAGVTVGSYLDTSPANGRTNLYVVAGESGCGEGATSPPAGVFLPLPALDLAVGQHDLLVRWPDWADDWQLYDSTGLAPPVTWGPVTNTVVGSNGLLNVRLPLDAPERYFQLRAP